MRELLKIIKLNGIDGLSVERFNEQEVQIICSTFDRCSFPLEIDQINLSEDFLNFSPRHFSNIHNKDLLIFSLIGDRVQCKCLADESRSSHETFPSIDILQ